MQPRAGMVRAGEAAAAEADGRHVEVAPVLLDEQVGRGLRGSEERVEALVDRHRDRDAVVVLVVLGKLEPRLELLERQEVRPVAVDLVRRREDERRVGLVPARRLEQVERAVRVDGEVGQRLRRRPVVRGLRGGVDRRARGRARCSAKSRSTPSESRMSSRRERNASYVVEQTLASAAPSTPRARRSAPACRSRSR